MKKEYWLCQSGFLPYRVAFGDARTFRLHRHLAVKELQEGLSELMNGTASSLMVEMWGN